MKSKHKYQTVIMCPLNVIRKSNNIHVGYGYSIWRDDIHIQEVWLSDFNGIELKDDYFRGVHTMDEPILAVMPYRKQ